LPEAQNLILKDIFNVKHTPNMEKHWKMARC
jgi:hypothetical protein